MSLSAQVPVKRSENITTEKNQKFYLHTVLAGQTMYSICKAYGVTQKDIAKANNTFSGVISVGQVLKIPIVDTGKSNAPDFLWHKVLPKETLYSLAKQFGITVNDIYSQNPDARQGLHIGQILKIPNIAKGNFDYQTDIFFVYTVQAGETLFSISQRYGKTPAQIVLFNPDAKGGIRVGQVLKIPKYNYDKTERLPVFHGNTPDLNNYTFDPLYFEDPGVTPCGRFHYSKEKSFNVAIMLPLYLNENSSYLPDNAGKKDKMFYKNSQRFFEMYEGILLAIQQLKLEGLSLNLYVYDTENDPEIVRQIMAKPEFEKTDLIIGPVYATNIKVLSYFIKKHHINLISPLSQNSELLDNNPFVYQVIPSAEMQVKKTSDFLSRLYDSSIVILHNGSEDELKMIGVYKQKLVSSFGTNPEINDVVLKIINYKTDGDRAIEDALSSGSENFIVMPSNDEVFVTQMIEKLHTYSKDYKISLIGSPQWDNFQNIESKYLKDLSFKYASPSYIDYNNWRVQSFLKKYRTVYNIEPSIYSYEGYDIAYYFGNALKTYGRNFQFCLSPFDSDPNPKGLVLNFDFARTGSADGFENNGMFMLEYDSNLKLIKAQNDK
jgi:LysM repeat protein/ABC-type branched-subunit amino acid transport system substrate-binding protein